MMAKMFHLMVALLLASQALASELEEVMQPIIKHEVEIMENYLATKIEAIASNAGSGHGGGACCAAGLNQDPGQSFDVFGNGGSYYLAFRGTAGVGKSAYDAYIKDYSKNVGNANNFEPCCKQVNGSLPCSAHYRNNAILDNWRFIEEVVVAVYDKGVLKQAITFDAAGTDYLSWFSSDKLKDAGKWLDLKGKKTNFFSIAGDNLWKRRFYINHNYGGCPWDAGWLLAVDHHSPPCGYEKHSSYPQFLYSREKGRAQWSKSGDVAQADVLAVFVKFATSCPQ